MQVLNSKPAEFSLDDLPPDGRPVVSAFLASQLEKMDKLAGSYGNIPEGILIESAKAPYLKTLSLKQLERKHENSHKQSSFCKAIEEELQSRYTRFMSTERLEEQLLDVNTGALKHKLICRELYRRRKGDVPDGP